MPFECWFVSWPLRFGQLRMAQVLAKYECPLLAARCHPARKQQAVTWCWGPCPSCLVFAVGNTLGFGVLSIWLPFHCINIHVNLTEQKASAISSCWILSHEPTMRQGREESATQLFPPWVTRAQLPEPPPAASLESTSSKYSQGLRWAVGTPSSAKFLSQELDSTPSRGLPV